MISKAQRARLEAQETNDTKTCLRCGKIKSLNDFYTNKDGRKFVTSQCKKCIKGSRGNDLLSLYGITLHQYDLMLKKQDDGCKICGTKTPKGRGRFHVDHEHSTGKIRGLLCSSCNIMLGLGHDDPKILIVAAHYLNASRKKLQ